MRNKITPERFFGFLLLLLIVASFVSGLRRQAFQHQLEINAQALKAAELNIELPYDG